MVNHDRMMPCRDMVLPPWLKTKPEDTVTPDTGDTTPYCLCRQPWSGRFMIKCDISSEWFHVNVSATDALNIDTYKCKSCKCIGLIPSLL